MIIIKNAPLIVKRNRQFNGFYWCILRIFMRM